MNFLLLTSLSPFEYNKLLAQVSVRIYTEINSHSYKDRSFSRINPTQLKQKALPTIAPWISCRHDVSDSPIGALALPYLIHKLREKRASVKVKAFALGRKR